jgi:hypothetical protein
VISGRRGLPALRHLRLPPGPDRAHGPGAGLRGRRGGLRGRPRGPAGPEPGRPGRLGVGTGTDEWLSDWDARVSGVPQRWVGWDAREAQTRVVAAVRAGRRRAGRVILEENPFYAEAGGQVSDVGTVEGEGWRLSRSTRSEGGGTRGPVRARLDGALPVGPPRARARVDRGPARHGAASYRHASPSRGAPRGPGGARDPARVARGAGPAPLRLLASPAHDERGARAGRAR